MEFPDELEFEDERYYLPREQGAAGPGHYQVVSQEGNRKRAQDTLKTVRNKRKKLGDAVGDAMRARDAIKAAVPDARPWFPGPRDDRVPAELVDQFRDAQRRSVQASREMDTAIRVAEAAAPQLRELHREPARAITTTIPWETINPAAGPEGRPIQYMYDPYMRPPWSGQGDYNRPGLRGDASRRNIYTDPLHPDYTGDENIGDSTRNEAVEYRDEIRSEEEAARAREAMLARAEEENYPNTREAMFEQISGEGYGFAGGNWFDDIGHELRHAGHQFEHWHDQSVKTVDHGLSSLGKDIHYAADAADAEAEDLMNKSRTGHSLMQYWDQAVEHETPNITQGSTMYSQKLKNYCDGQIKAHDDQLQAYNKQEYGKYNDQKQQFLGYEDHLQHMDDALPAIASSVQGQSPGSDPGLSPYSSNLDSKEQLQQTGGNNPAVGPNIPEDDKPMKQQVCGTMNCPTFDQCNIMAQNHLNNGKLATDNDIASRLAADRGKRAGVIAATSQHADDVMASLASASAPPPRDPGLNPYA